MDQPELKQFVSLTGEDFARHPVWIGCHTADYGQPWYDDTDEETFRPRTGSLPADPSEGMLLASATLELLDGSSYSGFVTPDFEGDLGNQQPHIFVGDQWFGFWSGLFGAQIEQREGFYAALGKKADAIFTLRFSVDARIATGHCNGQVHGFYRSVRGKEPEIEL